MTSILYIGVVTALVVFAIVKKTWASKPKKAQKSEKAAIMKQLLALSEHENGIAAIAPSRSRKPHAIPGMRTAGLPRKPTRTTSQPVPSSQGR
jgi:hypothetical protein